MFKILGRIPSSHFYIACSGGSDSMIFVDFLRKYPKNKFSILHFNHGTQYCDEAESFVREYCQNNNIELFVGKIKDGKQKNESPEEYWRRCRYDWLKKFSRDPIIMCHHLNDCIETWVMTCLSGKPRLIPYYNSEYNIIRPFLCVPKKKIKEWKHRHNVDHVVDGSNYDVRIPRNYVRHRMMEHIYKINPGIEKTLVKLIVEQFNQQERTKE